MFDHILLLFLVTQLGVFMGYYFSLPDIDADSIKRFAISHLHKTELHQVKIGEFASESFTDVRVRQMQDALRAARIFAKEETDALDNDVSLDTNGGIVGLSRMLERAISDMILSATASAPSGTLKACFEYQVPNDGAATTATAVATTLVSASKMCKSTEVVRFQRKIVIFNPYPRRRQWCGHGIDGGQVVTIEDMSGCEETWMNLAIFPPSSLAAADDGIEVVTSNYFDGSDVRKRTDCDVPCVWKGQAYGTLRVAGTKWEIIHSAEGPQYYDELEIDPNAHLGDRYYSTTSFRSEVPLPYFSWEEYDIKSAPVRYEDGIKGASFIAHNCDSKNDRESMVQGILDSGFRVDSLSNCLHNAEPPNGLGMDNKQELMRQYLFHLAFENQNEDDYITEKLWGALAAGTVPIYYGAPNIRDHVPAGSIIVAADFDTPRALGEYLAKVASDKTLYEKFHEWRAFDLTWIHYFVQKYNFTSVHSECRTCRWAYAKKHGFGFDHEQQRIAPLRLSRDVCTDEMTGMAMHPFKESYLTYDVEEHEYEDAQTHQSVSGRSSGNAQAPPRHATCSKRGLQSPFVFSNHEIERSIVEHDNVIDIVIAIKYRHIHQGRAISPLFLRLESIIESNRAYFTASDHRSIVSRRTLNHHDTVHWQTASDGMRYVMVQDQKSRLAVWTDWKTQMYSPIGGAIDILLLSGETAHVRQTEVIYRKIRVIVEDSNQLHYDDNDGSPTYFSRNAAKDFYHPLEVFFVDG